MFETAATLQTAHAGKYIAQLCRHFAHKVDVSYSENHGECRFVCGTAVMVADADMLQIRVTAPDETQLRETQEVIESHLVRFAFREELQPLQWLQSTVTDRPEAVTAET